MAENKCLWFPQDEAGLRELVLTRKTLDIMIDLDGVVYDFVDTLACWIYLDTGRPLHTMPPAMTWDFAMEQWGLTLEEFLGHYRRGVDAGYIFVEGEPIPGARWGLALLRSRGHRIHVITDRGVNGNDPKMVEKATKDWLAKHHIEVDTLVVSADKTVKKVDLALDDRDRNYDQLEAAGHSPYLLTRPWNAHHDGRRVSDWPAFIEVVIAKETAHHES